MILINNIMDYDILLRAVAEKIYQRSQEYVPVKTGTLKASGHIVKNGDIYSIIYSAPYAIYVHEIIEHRHTPPTRAKFLEDAGFEVLNELEDLDLDLTMGTQNSVILHLGFKNSESLERLKLEESVRERDEQNIADSIFNNKVKTAGSMGVI